MFSNVCSLEKIRPKKELQRATSEILRCKLEMRELVKHLDALCAEGKLQASSFDYQGQINCEDVCDVLYFTKSFTILRSSRD